MYYDNHHGVQLKVYFLLSSSLGMTSSGSGT